MVGSFNPISVAFAMLFVGLGADFAIQFSVRYRAQRHELHDLKPSLVGAAAFCRRALDAWRRWRRPPDFSPSCRRLSRHRGTGVDRRLGMLVAYIASMTLLPALLWFFSPPGEPATARLCAMASVDGFCTAIAYPSWRDLDRGARRPAVVVSPAIQFRSQQPADSDRRAVVALRQLNSDPRVFVNGADVLTPPAEAADVVKQVSGPARSRRHTESLQFHSRPISRRS